MDKLTPQTVYVPVGKHIEELPNVYPLTGEQLEELLTEYSRLSALYTVKRFLTKKGVTK
jgi:hypothetical protein